MNVRLNVWSSKWTLWLLVLGLMAPPALRADPPGGKDNKGGKVEKDDDDGKGDRDDDRECAVGKLSGWLNLALDWGTPLTTANSKIAEGDTVNLRYRANLTAGSTHTVYLKYDFTTGDGSSRFLDYLGSTTLPDVTILKGLTGAGTGADRNLPDDPGVPGNQALGKLRLFNCTVTSFGAYTLVNGVKTLPVTIQVASGPAKSTKNVVIGYGAHLSRGQDYAGKGSGTFAGTSRKASAKLDGGSESCVTINPWPVVTSADLSVTQIANPSPVDVGGLLTFTLTVRNNGLIAANGVVLTDTPPAGAVLTTSQGTVAANVVNLGTIAAGQQATVTVKVTAGCSAMVNSAVISSTTPDPVNNNNSVSTTVQTLDKTAPVLVGIPSLPIIAFAAPTQCGATVTLPTITAQDNCTAQPVVTGVRSDQQNLTATFPIGTTHVTFTAKDAALNSVSATFDVLVLPLNPAWPVATRLLLSEPDPNTGLSQGGIEECIAIESQSRWYKFRVKPGSKLLVTLENLPENYDVVLFKDVKKTYDELTGTQSGAGLTKLNAEFAADGFSADAFSSEAFAGAAFSGAAFSGPDFAGAAWSGAAFSGAAFSGAAWSPDVYAPDTFFGAAFSGAAFSGAAWSGAAWSADAVSGAAFSGAAWSGAAWSGAAWSGAAWSGAAFSGAAWSTEVASGAAWSGAAFSGAAFSDAQLRSIIGVSAFPGVGNEVILANTWDADEDYYIRVRGRNGVFSPGNNYKLRVQMLTGACKNVLPLDQLPPSNTPAPGPGVVKTVILTDFTRMGQFSGSPADVSVLHTRLDTFAALPSIQGVVVDVGQDARVAAANAQADASVTCVPAKNILAAAIRDIVLKFREAHPEIEYVVLVGNDAVIPFFRQPDQGLLANEDNYIPPVLSTTASEASLKLGYFLTQDPYGAACDLSLKVSFLPLPDLGVGRLVETPAEITAVLNAYDATTDGVVTTPTTALSTGYDFLADAAEAIAGEFDTGLGATTDRLIQPGGQLPQDGWTATDLRAKVLGSRHDLIFLGGHFSAAGALAADYFTRMTADELDASSVNLLNSVVISAGCHSGYNIVASDSVPAITPDPDWAQAFARKGAAFIAGTGYQYGDTDIIEYSERLYLNLARQLRAGAGPVAIGKALALAKAVYLAETPLMRGLHEKALLEATLFGLPMLKVNLPNGRGPIPSDSTVIGGLTPTGVPGATFNLKTVELPLNPITLTKGTSELKNVDDGASGTVTATYFAAGNGIVANPTEPMFPLEVRNVTVPGEVLRGIGFRSGTYTEEDDLRPLTSAPTTELSEVHTPFLTETYYPIKFWNVNYFDALCTRAGTADEATRLFVLPAQYISKAPGNPLGTFRKFSQLNFRLFYNHNTTAYTVTGAGSIGTITPAISAPPSILKVADQIDATNPAAQSVKFQVRVDGNPFAGIQEVWVTYTGERGTPGYYGLWQSLNLTQPDPVNDSTLWEGILPTGSTAPSSLRYIVQAASGVGLVALDTRLGAFYIPGDMSAVPTEPTTLQIDPPAPNHAEYSTKVTFHAHLKTNGSPLAGRVVAFGLGTQETQATTDADGMATVEFPVLGFPDTYDLRAAFAGDKIYRPSADALPFTIDKQATTLELTPTGTVLVLAGTHINFVATLKAGGHPLAERTVFFTFKPYLLDEGGNPILDNMGHPTFGSPSYYFPIITDFAGRARFESLPPGQVPDGTYDFFVSFGTGIPSLFIDGEDARFAPSSTADTVIYKTTAIVINNPADAIHFPENKITTTSADGTGDCLVSLGLITTVEPAIIANVTVSYAIGGTPIQSPYSFSTGVTTVDATAYVGTTVAATGSFTVTVSDDEPPSIVCPENVTRDANTDCTYVGGIGNPTAMDNCDPEVEVTNDAPSAFLLGMTTVTWTAKDKAGNKTTCTQIVTVVDNTAPVASGKNIQVSLGANGQVTITASQVDNGSSDNCHLANLTLSKYTFTCADLGDNTVALTAIDDANLQNSVNVTVTVVDDTAPTAVCRTASAVFVEDSGWRVRATDINNGSSDNCSIASLEIGKGTLTKNSNGFGAQVFFNEEQTGTRTVTLRVTDQSGNRSVCTVSVTVGTQGEGGGGGGNGGG